MQIEILPADRTDLNQILQLQKACFHTEADLHNEYHIPALLQDLQSLEQEFETTIFLKAMADGLLVGSVRCTLKNNTCYIGRLIVNERYQNRGIGQKLMNAMEKANEQCIRFELFTGFKSEKNLYLYQKLGYSEFKRQKINENLTLVFLEKEKV